MPRRRAKEPEESYSLGEMAAAFVALILLAVWEVVCLAAWALAWGWHFYAALTVSTLPPPWVKRWLRGRAGRDGEG